MSTLSLCMIVKNEHATLARCLESIHSVVDEIIIVDTGSSDDTKAIANIYTQNVYDYEWQDDFSAARNFSFSNAHCDYIMWMDADDVLPEKNRDLLLEYKSKLDILRPDVVMMRYDLAFDSDGNCTLWNYRERIMRRTRGFMWSGAVHEVITPSGKIEYSDIALEHRPNPRPLSERNLRIYENMKAKGIDFTARDSYYYARELLTHARYADAATQLEEFLSRPDGWKEDRYAACMLLSQCRAAENDPEATLAAYMKTFEIDAPRAGLCCALGRFYVNTKHYPAAEFWFKCALSCPHNSYGFVDEDEFGFVPYLWLCVCRDRQGDTSGAFAYNELARGLHPDDPAVLYNVEYFKRIADKHASV